MPSPPESPPAWPVRLAAAWQAFRRWLVTPRVRLAVTGVTLLALGGLFFTSSVWTLPLVVIGAVMVAVAWVGHRLDGRFAIEWGEAGAEVAFRATLKAPAVPTPAIAAGAAQSPAALSPVIEGEAHTVEIDVAELKALIAAAEAAAQTPEIRVRRLTEDAPKVGGSPAAAGG